MTLTVDIPDELQARLTAQAARSGLAPGDYLLALAQAASDAEQQEREDTMASLRRSAEQFAAGHWQTPEELDALLASRRP